jgi:hypothetical protein
MLGLILMLIYRGTAAATMAVVRAARKAGRQTICSSCTLAHIQRTAKNQSMISCTFGGAVRPMKLVVLSCSGYRDQAAALRTRHIGFG